MSVSLGYKASAEQFGPRDCSTSPRAERVGLDGVAISDHFQPWRHRRATPRSRSAGSARSASDQARALGTSVLTPTFATTRRSSPTRSRTLACLNPGRVFLGVGTGEAMNETPATARAWPGPKERRLRLAEAIELIRRSGREERVTFEGEYYRTERATIYDRPGRARADLRGRVRPAGGEARRPGRRRLHLHERQEAGAVPSAARRRWPRARATAGRDPAESRA